MSTTVINLRHKDSNDKSGYTYYKQKYGDSFEYIGDKIRFQPHIPRTIWYNPYHKQIKKLGRKQVVRLYEEYILKQSQLLSKIPVLKDKVLACWCIPELCHGDVLLALLANEHNIRP